MLKSAILGFWQGKSYTAIFTWNIAQKFQSQQGVKRTEGS